MILETTALVQQIEERCRNCLNNAKRKALWYMNLIEEIQNPITMQDLKMIEGQLEVPLSFSNPLEDQEKA